jgi:predicted transcriptional regulator
MILAFLIDQVQQIACPLFRAVLNKLKQKKEVWEQMRSLFKSYAVNSIETIWKSIVYGFNKPNLESLDTS